MILITGGLGYLGSRVTKHLLNSGHNIKLATHKNDSVVLPTELSNCNLINIDLLNSESLIEACENVTTIIHLAAMNAQECSKNPEQALLINGLGTLNLLRAAEKQSVSNFIYFSTGHIYGSPLKDKITESTLPRPTHPYSITHRLAEDYVIEYSKNYNFSGTVFRLSNAVGSPLTKDSNCWMLVANDLARQAISEHNITIHSHASILRDFFPISDICIAIDFVLKGPSNKGCNLYNIGSGHSISLNDLATIITCRYKVIFGEKININLLTNERSSTQSPRFIFSIDKITNSGCVFEKNIVREIDQLLKNCHHWFSNL